MSKRFTLNSEDWAKWRMNLLVFFAPVASMYLLAVQANINLDGFQTADFYPSQVVMGGMIYYVVSTLLDLTKKFVTKN